MIKLIIGLIILLTPFLLIEKFKNKVEGFFTIITLSITFHLILALITQALGIFNYTLILIINLAIISIILFKIDYSNLKNTIKRTKFDPVLIPVITFLSIIFYSVHYNFTGIISKLGISRMPIENLSYTYPYFSDEWVAIKLINYIIGSGNLPISNPYWHNIPFSNFVFAFQSFLSEIFLLLDLNPLTNYVKISIIVSILICLTVFAILKINKIGSLPAAIACMSIAYIVNGSNLPGLWTLIPVILGLLTFLISLIFIKLKNNKMLLVSSFLTLLFYPPFVIFLLASIIATILFNKKKKYNLKKISLILGITILAAAIVLMITAYNLSFDVGMITTKILEKLIFLALPAAIINFPLWIIIPPIILIVSLFGLNKFKENAWLISPVAVGLMLWTIYSLTIIRTIISYERTLFITSILIVILSGFGIANIEKILNKNRKINRYKLTKWTMAIIIGIMLIFSFSYTERTNWQKLEIRLNEEKIIIIPASPANQYLTEEDLRIFSNISHKNFTAPPWKGLVIGTATNNYPLNTKDSTIYLNILNNDYFMSLNCDKKTIEALRYNINYVYSSEINCPNFEYVDKSNSENLYLYKFNG